MADAQQSFEGWMGGATYDLIARLTGYGPDYYRRAALAIPVRPGMTLLDLGCGTASLSLALAERMHGSGHITGIDLSARQLDRARSKVGRAEVPIDLRQGSVHELPFDDRSIDGIAMSQVLHGLPDSVRAQCLAEAARVLRPGGFFALVDWSRPHLGFTAAIWTATLLGMRDSVNWRGAYEEIFGCFGFVLATDVYLDSLNRCQVFVRR